MHNNHSEPTYSRTGCARSSQFWGALHAIKRWFKSGLAYRVGISYVWLVDTPLGIQLSTLFSCCDL
uniref:Uncharacterized protein n=1 Tax=Aegilops tauschii subsp. strangulata TaxID=200361 RepID=A0A453TCI3_AEGTS